MIPLVVQNADRNVSARDYAQPDALAVTTFFRTLQGEGPLAGRCAIFVRLAGCNYGSKTDMCRFCDTSFQLDKASWYSPDRLLVELTELQGYNARDVLVVTGGEPTMQLALLDLIVKANGHFAEIQIETNGTQPKFFKEAEERGLTAKNFVTVVSPKANERLKKYPPVSPVVTWWASDLKYVLSADPESAHHTIPDAAIDLAAHTNRRVWVSPMTVYRKAYAGEVSSIWDAELVDQEATARNYAYAAAYALKHNLRLSVQVHTLTAIP